MSSTKLITIEEAQAVIAAFREEELRQKIAESQQYVGRYYRYRNSSSLDRERWWMYFAVTSVDESGSPVGWSFQIMPSPATVQIATERPIYVWGGGYEQITPLAFWREAKKLAGVVEQILVERVDPADVFRG